MKESTIIVKKVGMRFVLSKEKISGLKEYVIKRLKNEIKYNKFWALKDISFEVQKGDRVGILGLNGAGKSTLLKIIAGVMKPTEGEVIVKGKVVPLLELSAGFDSEYTGRENIFLRGAVLGFKKDFIEERFKEIIEFAELGKFIDVPVKNYSSGMRARLGFAISTLVDPDVLILDEVLSVGDALYRQKSTKKIMSLINNKGTTVLFVSHSISHVRRICNKALWLEEGRVVMFGDVDEVTNKYEEMTG